MWQGSLSSGSVMGIYQSEAPTPDPTQPPPTLQVLSVKLIQSTAAKAPSTERYRLVLSDGQHYIQGMLATQLNGLVNSNLLAQNCVIFLKKYVCNTVQNRRIVILLEVDVLGLAPEQIGNPVVVYPKSVDDTSSGMPNQVEKSSAPSYAPPSVPIVNKNSFVASHSSFSAPQESPSKSNCHPIASLNPYQTRWTIKARVTAKSEIRVWQNARGEGKLFSVDLLDDSGEIRATGFNQVVDKFYDLLQVNKTFFISKGTLKISKKQFTSIKNEYELSFDNNTVIEPCPDDGAVPKIRYEFTPIASLEGLPKDTIIDLIAVVKESGECSSITSKSTGKPFMKRDLQVVDQSQKSVNLTLWGSQAESFDGSNFPIICIKGCRVSDFGGVSLSPVQGANICLNPDIPESHKLRGWFDAEGKNITVSSVSGNSSSGNTNFNEERKHLGEIMNANIAPDKVLYFTTAAFITLVKHDNALYKACPTDMCNKKIVESGPNEYFCDKCNKTVNTFSHRLMIRFSCSDFSGQYWFTAFNDQAQEILGKSATEVGMLKESGNESAYEAVFQDAHFKRILLKARAKTESYQDEVRIRCNVMSCAVADPVTEGKRLLQLIAQY